MKREIKIPIDELVNKLVSIKNVCLLDSGAVKHLESHLLIAGIEPREVLNLTDDDADKTLNRLDEKLSNPNFAYIFTISYDFGLKLQNIKPRPKEHSIHPEPDVFLAAFDCLLIHDYDTRRTFLTGDAKRFDRIEKLLLDHTEPDEDADLPTEKSVVSSNFTRREYIEAVEKIQERIRRGDTYQTNLTQQLRAELPEHLTAQKIFRRLRKSHPAPFAALINRESDTVVSISPERFFKTEDAKRKTKSGQAESRNADSTVISASPIKGTRPRGKSADEDERLKNELLASEKDTAENVMIVDLLRNDIGRICKFGSVAVEKLCDLETHPTLFHLVSTIAGELRGDVKFSDIIRAVYPCGSITGAPKISTMQLIDEIETANRGLSMGAIGCSINGERFKTKSPKSDSETDRLPLIADRYLDLSVAIRTMVVRGREAIFNVGGGIVIDSAAEEEYAETLTKAKALLNALNAGDWAEKQTV